MNTKTQNTDLEYSVGDWGVYNAPWIPTHDNTPKIFKITKVDKKFGVVYYKNTDGKQDTIGMSYIRPAKLYEIAFSWFLKYY